MNRQPPDLNAAPVKVGDKMKIKGRAKNRSPYAQVTGIDPQTHKFNFETLDAYGGKGNRKQRRAQRARQRK